MDNFLDSTLEAMSANQIRKLLLIAGMDSYEHALELLNEGLSTSELKEALKDKRQFLLDLLDEID